MARSRLIRLARIVEPESLDVIAGILQDLVADPRRETVPADYVLELLTLVVPVPVVLTTQTTSVLAAR